jgi:hypothetical protein
MGSKGRSILRAVLDRYCYHLRHHIVSILQSIRLHAPISHSLYGFLLHPLRPSWQPLPFLKLLRPDKKSIEHLPKQATTLRAGIRFYKYDIRQVNADENRDVDAYNRAEK